jgi:hypothetical protein
MIAVSPPLVKRCGGRGLRVCLDVPIALDMTSIIDWLLAECTDGSAENVTYNGLQVQENRGCVASLDASARSELRWDIGVGTRSIRLGSGTNKAWASFTVPISIDLAQWHRHITKYSDPNILPQAAANADAIPGRWEAAPCPTSDPRRQFQQSSSSSVVAQASPSSVASNADPDDLASASTSTRGPTTGFKQLRRMQNKPLQKSCVNRDGSATVILRGQRCEFEGSCDTVAMFKEVRERLAVPTSASIRIHNPANRDDCVSSRHDYKISKVKHVPGPWHVSVKAGPGPENWWLVS